MLLELCAMYEHAIQRSLVPIIGYCVDTVAVTMTRGCGLGTVEGIVRHLEVVHILVGRIGPHFHFVGRRFRRSIFVLSN